MTGTVPVAAGGGAAPRLPTRIILLTHTPFPGLTRQDRFAALLAQGLRARGVEVVERTAPARPALAKWAGHADQFLLFPPQLAAACRSDPTGSFHVVCDQALGPWVPWVAGRPHLVHCHDPLALRSALGLLPDVRPGASGRLYQRWIRAGLCRARHFASVSAATRDERHRLTGVRPLSSEVIPNAPSPPSRRCRRMRCRRRWRAPVCSSSVPQSRCCMSAATAGPRTAKVCCGAQESRTASRPIEAALGGSCVDGGGTVPAWTAWNCMERALAPLPCPDSAGPRRSLGARSASMSRVDPDSLGGEPACGAAPASAAARLRSRC